MSRERRAGLLPCCEGRLCFSAASGVALVALVAACPPSQPIDPKPKPPPQAFVTLPDGNVIAPSVTGTLNVTGCAQVRRARLLHAGAPIVDVTYSGPNTPFELTPAQLAGAFKTDGIALPLSLALEVTCDDGRSNTSATAAATFFPVTSVAAPSSGGQAFPETFVAEGGTGATPTTLIGCVSAGGVVGLARVSTSGALLGAVNTALPFPCSPASVITERHEATGTRWLWESGQGAFAFDGDLGVRSAITGKLTRLTQASDGDALATFDSLTVPYAIRLAATPSSTDGVAVWRVDGLGGIVAASPAIDVGRGHAFLAVWHFNICDADTVAIKVGWATGDLLLDPPTAVLRQTYPCPSIESPLPVSGAFNEDGQVLYLPLSTLDPATQARRTVVHACATGVGGCEGGGSGRKWTSPALEGQLTTVLPYASGSRLAAAGASGVWLLDAQTGATKSLGQGPVTPTGRSGVLALQPGRGADFYVLAGSTPYPTELVGLDLAEQGVLFRFTSGAGTAPSAALTTAVDDGGQLWVRTGPRLVRPLGNAAYRGLRGPTPSSP